jgi:hypothetical protein
LLGAEGFVSVVELFAESLAGALVSDFVSDFASEPVAEESLDPGFAGVPPPLFLA